LLQWAEHPLKPAGGKQAPEISIRVTLTQEEIAQMVGTSRETVSRILGDFRRKGWLRIKGATWSIVNLRALKEMVTT
jgi:CRP-like cAMP-binding protein